MALIVSYGGYLFWAHNTATNDADRGRKAHPLSTHTQTHNIANICPTVAVVECVITAHY